MTRRLTVQAERWPLSRPFRIARGAKDAADVVVARLEDDGVIGVGEAVPYARYGETIAGVVAQIEAAGARLSRAALQEALPPGAARNALDCALWDLEAKRSGRSAADIAGVAAPRSMITAVTIALDSADRMHEAARASAAAPLLKVKVDADDPLQRIEAVRAAAPSARLIVDPNESWSGEQLVQWLPDLERFDIAFIEQPIAASNDAALDGLRPSVPLCADESVHVTADLARVARCYQAVNIKLDKTGGLTEAFAMRRAAAASGLGIMVGCMICTSLSILPALLIADGADAVDLDGPWWLAQDRADAVTIVDGVLTPPRTGWGQP